MSIPNLGNIGKKPSPSDFMGPQPTNLEKMAYEITNFCEMKSMNLARQVRTICMLMKIEPKDFVRMYSDDMAHNKYVQDTIAEQKIVNEEIKKKNEEIAKLAEDAQKIQKEEAELPTMQTSQDGKDAQAQESGAAAA